MAPVAQSRACASSGPMMASSVSGVTSSRSRRKASRLSFAATAASSAAVTAAAACCCCASAAFTSAADSDFPARATRAFSTRLGSARRPGARITTCIRVDWRIRWTSIGLPKAERWTPSSSATSCCTVGELMAACRSAM